MSMLKSMGRVLVNCSLGALWVSFGYVNYLQYLKSGGIYLILLIIAEGVIALMFVVRKKEHSASDSPLEWLVAVGATLLPLAVRPASEAVAPALGAFLSTTGCLLMLVGVLSLNRSFGIVPANRGIKTGGMYRAVRHPLYFSYLLMYLGYLLANTSLVNAAIVAAWLPIVFARILFEERHLLGDQDYRDYTRAVRWRLVPGLF